MRDRDVAIIAGAIIIVILLFGFGGGMMGMGMMGPGMMGWGRNGAGVWWGLVMMASWLLLLVAVGTLIAWLVRSTQRAGAGSTGQDRAMEILRERYARGEISREEFEHMCQDLQGPSGSPGT